MSDTKVKKIPLYSDKPYEYNWNRELKNHNWFNRALMPLAGYILHREFSDITYYGVENVPQTGGFILASNHSNGMDPISVTYGFRSRRLMFFMAKEEFFHAFYLRWAMLLFNAFPIKRNSPDLDAIEYSKRVIDAGYGLVVFPQGTRDRERKRPESGHPGVAMLAREAHADVLPVSVHLSSDLNDHHPKCVVRYGEMIPYEELGFTEGVRRSRELKTATQTIMDKIGELWDKDQM